MLIRNAYIYSWKPAPNLLDLEPLLAPRIFSKLGELDAEHLGWINPKEIEHGALVHAVDGLRLVALQKEVKIIPVSSVKRKLARAVDAFTKAEGRAPTRKERTGLRNAVRDAMLPTAPTRLKVTFGVFDRNNERLLILTTSSSSADEFVAVYTDCCMRHNFQPGLHSIRTHQLPQLKMFEWLESGGRCGDGFALGEDCELFHDKSRIKYTRLDLDRPEILEQLRIGMLPIRLGLVHEDAIKFVLMCSDPQANLLFSKIHYGEDDSTSEEDALSDDVFDTNLLFCVEEILRVSAAVFDALGGISLVTEGSGTGSSDSESFESEFERADEAMAFS